MPARALTDTVVKALRADDGQRLVVYDAKARGLCLRVTPRTKSWSFVYRPEGCARQRRYTIGDYPAWGLVRGSRQGPRASKGRAGWAGPGCRQKDNGVRR